MALAIYIDKGTLGAALPWRSLIGIGLSLAALDSGALNALNIRIARAVAQELGPGTPPLLPSMTSALLNLAVVSPVLMGLSQPWANRNPRTPRSPSSPWASSSPLPPPASPGVSATSSPATSRSTTSTTSPR